MLFAAKYSLKREITAILVVKLVAIVAIGWIYFGDPDEVSEVPWLDSAADSSHTDDGEEP